MRAWSDHVVHAAQAGLGRRADAFDPDEPRDEHGEWSAGSGAYKAKGRGGGGVLGRAKGAYGEKLSAGQSYARTAAEGNTVAGGMAAKAYRRARLHEARVGKLMRAKKQIEAELAPHEAKVKEAKGVRNAATKAFREAYPKGEAHPDYQRTLADVVRTGGALSEAIAARRVARNKLLRLTGNRHGDSWRTDSFADDIAKAFDELLRTLGVDKFLTRMADAIGRSQARYIKKVAKVQLSQVASANDLEAFRQANLSLIRSLGAEQVQKVADILRPAQAIGQRWEDVADDIQTRLDIGTHRARLIARDQTNKWNGRMMQQSQTQAGITSYRWSTAKDLAVRGRPGGEYAKSKDKHWPLEGKVFEWSDPPTIPGTSERAAPGESIQCRCVAVPIVPWLER